MLMRCDYLDLFVVLDDSSLLVTFLPLCSHSPSLSLTASYLVALVFAVDFAVCHSSCNRLPFFHLYTAACYAIILLLRGKKYGVVLYSPYRFAITDGLICTCMYVYILSNRYM